MRLLATVAVIALASPGQAAGLCADPGAWPGGPDATVEFEAVMALQPGRAGDGPHRPEPVSLTGDVLGLGHEERVETDGGLSVDAIVCVRERPEWLGLALRNGGAEDTAGRLTLTLPDGRVLEAEVPSVAAGGERLLLLRASDPIADAALSLATED